MKDFYLAELVTIMQSAPALIKIQAFLTDQYNCVGEGPKLLTV